MLFRIIIILVQVIDTHKNVIYEYYNKLLFTYRL